MAAGKNRTVVTALVISAGTAIAKFIGFVITGSSSMLSEAVHSLADASNQLLLLLGLQKARRKANHDKPFGYGRERYFWSFAVAMIVFSLGGLFSIYEGMNKLDDPTKPTSPGVALVILVIAMGLEVFAFMTARSEAERLKGRNNWQSFIRRSKNPEIPVVLLENAGALIGSSIAFVGILLASFVSPVFDGIATVLIGALLVAIAIMLAIEMKSLVIGESASPENRDRLVASIEGHRDVVRLIDMRTQHLGPDQILVGAKVHYRDTLDTVQLAEALNQTELDMRSAVDERLTIYLEPDLFDSEPHADQLADDDDRRDPFADFDAGEPDSESGESVVDRASHDDRNIADGRDNRRDQPESFASAFGMEEAITTPNAGDEPAVDLAAVDEAARVRAEMAATNVATSVPLPGPGPIASDEDAGVLGSDSAQDGEDADDQGGDDDGEDYDFGAAESDTIDGWAESDTIDEWSELADDFDDDGAATDAEAETDAETDVEGETDAADDGDQKLAKRSKKSRRKKK